jgi:antitoxin (DNA-binding transcriptional repressor) of toxin-antitoxin stability system
MDISITEFKSRCLAIIRSLEKDGKRVRITRRGRIVAELSVSSMSRSPALEPWRRLRGSGKLKVDAGESVLHDREFDAWR